MWAHPVLGFSAHDAIWSIAEAKQGKNSPSPTVTSPVKSQRPVVMWLCTSTWRVSLTHNKLMGGGLDDRGSLRWPVDGDAVDGEVDDDGGSDQLLP
jgi:hypothetical protein